MMRIKLLLTLWVAMLLAGSAAWAAPFGGLYETEVAVADRAVATRDAALSEALRRVVIKVTGIGSAADGAVIGEALRTPTRYLLEYSYRTNDNAAATQLPLLMGVSFNSRSVDQLLQGAGLKPWGPQRPLTLVWLAVEQGGQRLLVGANDRGQVREMVERAASRRGLPLRLPLLDAADQARVQATDVWGELAEPIRQASQRYQAQAILVGRLAQLAPGRWQVRWTLYRGESSQHWSQQGTGVEALIAYGINAATDTLASTAASVVATPAVAAGNQLHWVVKDVRNLRSYRRLIDYLAALPGVSGVHSEQISSDSVRLRITVTEGAAPLQQQVAQGNVLAVVAAGATAPSAVAPSLIQPGDRIYRLVP